MTNKVSLDMLPFGNNHDAKINKIVTQFNEMEQKLTLVQSEIDASIRKDEEQKVELERRIKAKESASQRAARIAQRLAQITE